MKKYLVMEECNCSLTVLGEYTSLDEAEEAAAILEECGLKIEIKEVNK